MKPEQLHDLVRIKPETAGEWAFENNRTIVFKPTKSFERDTRYEVKADLSEWFDTERKDKYFTFRFSTQPLLLRANLQSVDINRKNENGYDIVCSVFTPDKEMPETVESRVRFYEKADSTWPPSPKWKEARSLHPEHTGWDGRGTCLQTICRSEQAESAGRGTAIRRHSRTE